MSEFSSFSKSEIVKPSTLDTSSFDPDKRIDVNRQIDRNSVEGYDVDKRVDVAENNGIERLKCLNEDLAGNVHPKTGVVFERKVVDLGDKKVEGVFPVFDSDFDIQLPKELLTESDVKQFKECNRQLKDELNNNLSLREKFTDEQIEQIMDGETPDGKVWHHNEEVGKMQLVDFDTHDKTAHRGGKSIWGGGKECR